MQSLRVFIMAWLLLVGLIGTGLVGPVRPMIEQEFGLSHTGFGAGLALIQIAVNLVLLLAVLPRLGRVGAAMRLLLGLACSTVGLVLSFLSHTWVGYLAGWTVLLAGNMLSSATNHVSMALWAHNPRRGVTLLHAFNAIGKVLGPVVVVVSLTWGWRGGYQVAAALCGLLLAAFLLLQHRWTPVLAEVRGSQAPHGEAFRLPLYWFALAGIGAIAGGEAAFASLMPTYFIKVRGLEPGMASGLFTLHLVGLALGRFAAARCGATVSSTQVIGACLTAGLAVFPAVYAPSPWLYAPALFALGFMFSATWPAFYAQAAAALPEHRELLAYGSALGNAAGMAVCWFVSSVIADQSLALSLLFGPCVLWLFGLAYRLSPISRVGA